MPTRILLTDLTPAHRDALCNGCGPGGWKRHTWRWWLARWLTPDLYEICQQHDLDYTVGGDERARELADGWFREAIALRARQKRIVGWLLEDEQPILFALVETQGRAHFNDHGPLTLDQVRALAERRIVAAAA